MSFAIEKSPSLWGEQPLGQSHGCRKGTREQREKENSQLLGQIQPIKLDILGRNILGVEVKCINYIVIVLTPFNYYLSGQGPRYKDLSLGRLFRW